LEDRTVRCWGSPLIPNGLGSAVVNTAASSPRMVQSLEDAVSIEAGELQACALLRNGNVKCWQYEELVARTVLGLVEVTAIASGGESTCALLRDKTVKCWGLNRAGELGDGVTTRSADPVAVRNLADVRLLAAGGYHFCAVKQDNSVRCWGAVGSSYELGGTDTAVSNLPVVVRFAHE
jgi:hypothetical protein